MLEQKYLWRIGSPPPFLDRHSQTKHTIIEEYVKQYVLTLMAQATIPELRLSIIDGFCGGGCYQTETEGISDGSPLLIMRAIREARAYLNLNRRTQRSINVNYSFIDNLPDTTQYLQNLLSAKLNQNAIDLIDYKKTEVITSDFLKSLPSIIKNVQQNKMGEHALFLLDQYCYKDIPLPQIANILHTLKGAEVIMTFNVDNLTTYLSDHANNRKALKNIGLDKYLPWKNLSLIKTTQTQEWRQTLQQHVAHGIKCETGAKFMTLFFVKPLGLTSWGYWLIHLSNSYRAHAVMKSLHWEHATEFGHELDPGIFALGYNANKDSVYTGQETFEFSGNGSKDACINGVREHFGKLIYKLDTPTRLGDIFQNCISNSTAAESQLIEATRQLHISKNIVVTSKDGSIIRRATNKTFNLNDIIEASKQIILT